MKVTWIIPDTYGFLLDELECLSQKQISIKVLSGQPIADRIKKRLPLVQFHYCPPKSILWASIFTRIFDKLWKLHGWRLVRQSYFTGSIAGIYSVLNKLEADNKSDLIHCHFAYPSGIGGGLIQCPQILTLRGYDILTIANYGSLWNYFFRSNLMAYAKSNIIVTGGSEYIVSRARQILGSYVDIRYLKEGLPTLSFQSADVFTRSRLNIDQDATVILSVGNLVEIKNHDLLLRVFAEVVYSQNKTLHLIICGDGPNRSALEALSKSLKIERQVSFMGQLKREELTDIYKVSDIFVHTSMSEGFGNVIVEAMLFELLVVASPVGVAADIINHKKNGYLPQLGSHVSWVECLKEAIANIEQFTDQLDVNKAMVEKDFTIEARIDSYINLYKETIESFKNNAGN